MLVNKEEEQQDELARVCITPSVKTFAEMDRFLAFIRSHEWIVDRAEEFGKDAILNKIHCKHCGLERMSILAQITESQERARDYRRELTQTIHNI